MAANPERENSDDRHRHSFGSKAELFDTVLEHYVTGSESLSEHLQRDQGVDGLHQWARRVHKVVSSGSTPSGCLMVMSINELAEEPVDIEAQFTRWRNNIQVLLHDTIELAQQRGELSPGNANVRAALLYAANLGLLTAARSDGSDDLALISAGIHETIDSWVPVQ